METWLIAKTISKQIGRKVLRSEIENAITELGLRLHPEYCEVAVTTKNPLGGVFVYNYKAVEKIQRRITENEKRFE
jgi:hypothetical protein